MYAKKVIKKMHPLQNLDIEVCLPFLDPVIGVTKRCFGHRSALKTVSSEERIGLADADSLKQRSDDAMTKADLEMGQAVDEDGDPLFDFHLEEGEDALTRLGYGVVSYFQLIYTMMLIFALITVFFIPVMYNNLSWEAYAGQAQISATASTTLGNLGQSMARCSSL